MEPMTIIAIGKLLFEIYNTVTEKVVDAENNPQLKDGYKKHQHVKQEVCRIIDEKTLDDGTKQCIKECVDNSIRDQVYTLHKKGMFSKE